MLAFVIRRLIGMVAVLFGVSVLVYIVFILIPGGDPAERMAGKNPLRTGRICWRHRRFRQAVLRSVRTDDGKGR